MYFFRSENTSYSSPQTAPYPSPSAYPSPVDANGYPTAANYYETPDSSSMLPQQGGEVSSTEELAATYIRDFEEAYRGLPSSEHSVQAVQHPACNNMISTRDNLCDNTGLSDDGYYIIPDYGYSDPDTTISYTEQDFMQPGEIFNLEQPLVPSHSNLNYSSYTYPPRLTQGRAIAPQSQDETTIRLSPNTIQMSHSSHSMMGVQERGENKESVDRLHKENPGDYPDPNEHTKYHTSNNNNIVSVNQKQNYHQTFVPFSPSVTNYTDKVFDTSVNVGIHEDQTIVGGGVDRQTLEWTQSSQWTGGYSKQGPMDVYRADADPFMFDVNLQVTN